MIVHQLSELRDEINNIVEYSPHNIVVVNTIACTILAANIPSAPECIWANIMGTSGCGKSLILGLFSGSEGTSDPWTISLDSISAKALMSGLAEKGKLIDKESKDDDPSLFAKADRKSIIVHDSSQMENMRGDEQRALMADLRSATAGRMSKAYGTGVRTHTARCNFIIGCTTHFDRFLIYFQELGGRYICTRYWHHFRDFRHQTRQAKKMSGTKYLWEPHLKLKVIELLKPAITDFRNSKCEDILADAPEALGERVIDMADFVGYAKTFPTLRQHQALPTDCGMKGSEMGTRLGVVYHTMGCCFNRLSNKSEWDEDTMSYVSRLAWDTIPNLGQRILAHLHLDKACSASTIASKTRFPPVVISTILRQYQDTELVTDKKVPGMWTLTDDTRTIMDRIWPASERHWWPRSAFTVGVTI